MLNQYLNEIYADLKCLKIECPNQKQDGLFTLLNIARSYRILALYEAE